MADKIVKAFEVLRSHYLQESNAQQPAVVESAETPASSGKPKKDVSLTSQERINYCNAIADFLPMQTVKNINEFPRLLTLAMELLLVCCDDKEADVRLVAGECINKITKAFLDSNFGRIQVELYKEIKKNGASRSLRAALQRFGDTCHLIRVHKCRPYIANLLPCIVKIVKREDDPVQEVMGIMMFKLCPVLGMFMNEHDIKILLRSFLPNLASSSATSRRTAAATLNTLCKYSRKPAHFYSWLVTMLLGSITPLTNELSSHTILGALLCFRNIVPNLGECCEETQTMKDSFGSRAKKNEPNTVKDLVLEKKQFLQIYEVTMFCTKHSDHNIVTAALENLSQILSSKAKPILEILLSSNGIAPTITGVNFSVAVDSGVSDDSLSEGSMSLSDKMKLDELSDKLKLDDLSIGTNDSGLGEPGQLMESTLFSNTRVSFLSFS